MSERVPKFPQLEGLTIPQIQRFCFAAKVKNLKQQEEEEGERERERERRRRKEKMKVRFCQQNFVEKKIAFQTKAWDKENTWD